MEEQIQRLVDQTWKRFQEIDESQRYLIAVAGIPGSGKTTAAASVVHGLNRLHHEAWSQQYPNAADYNGVQDPSRPDVALVVPLDGYHLTRKQLSEMPNPEEAAYRRGAAFTFNAQEYLKLVQQLRKPIEAGTRTIYAPSFDHAVKDPVENDIRIPPKARILFIEGLYVAMDREGWRDAAELMDELWFIDVSVETATGRVAKRNLVAGLSTSYDEAIKRTIASDMRNAREILAERLPIQETIHSIYDEQWKSEELKQIEKEEELHEPLRKKAQRMNSIIELAEAGVGM